MPAGSEFDREEFASAFARFVQSMNTEATPPASPVREVALDVFGADPSELPVVSEDIAITPTSSSC